MKEMVYTAYKTEVLEDAVYKSYRFIVVSRGSHPCVYVQIPSGRFSRRIQCHGGITYADEGVPNVKNTPGTWIGWDFKHNTDYFYSARFIHDGKKWTIGELIQEAHSVIDQLSRR